MLRNSLTSLSPFPFKTCSERIIDFHFLALTKFSDKNFGRHFTLLECCNCRYNWPRLFKRWTGGQGAKRRGLGTTKTAKQLSKQGTRQIEFSDAFKTKIGSCPVPASKRFWAACGYRRIFKFQTFARFQQFIDCADIFSLLVAIWQ